jgi:hypothetical protein
MIVSLETFVSHLTDLRYRVALPVSGTLFGSDSELER